MNNDNQFTPEDRERMKRMEGSLEKLELTIFGDRFEKEKFPGIFQVLVDHSLELYGDKKTERVGLIQRVAVIWEDRIKVYAICGAVAFVGGIVGWLAMFFLKGKI